MQVKRSYDIIVAGGGVAGVAAALTARRRGKTVLLLEKSIILGGLSTLGLVNYFVPMDDGKGHQVCFGMADEWLRQSDLYGYGTMDPVWRNRVDGRPAEATTKRLHQHYSAYIFAMQLTEKVVNAGVDLLFDCLATEPVMENGICKGVVTESKSGRQYFEGKMIIDTTGDADLLRRIGVPTRNGTNYSVYVGDIVSMESCKKALETGMIRDAYQSFYGSYGKANGKDHPEGVPYWSGTTVEDVTDYAVYNQLQMLEKLKNDAPGHTREVVRLPLMPQFRTTCHLVGEYVLTKEDENRHFGDSIAAINDLLRRGYLFEVPYRCLYRKEYPNLLTAGRSASGDGHGWEMLRPIPPAILTGQAAANAAVLAIDAGCSVADVDIRKLQEILEKQDHVMIHFPDEWLSENGTVMGENVTH